MQKNLLDPVTILDSDLIVHLGKEPNLGLATNQSSIQEYSINQLSTNFLAQIENQTKAIILKIDKSIFPDCPKLAKVFEYIEDNYSQKIKLADLAKAVNYSEAYLSYLVSRLSGKSPIDWIIERRLVEAASLLLETDWKIKDIASVVGYSDESYFFRSFKDYYGSAPEEWRKEQRSISSNSTTNTQL